jgi:hypothetical protein
MSNEQIVKEDGRAKSRKRYQSASLLLSANCSLLPALYSLLTANCSLLFALITRRFRLFTSATVMSVDAAPPFL